MHVSTRLSGAAFAALAVLGILSGSAEAGPRRLPVRPGWGPPPALVVRARERAADLEWARHDPPATEIWDGRALNLLLRNAIDSRRVDDGPTMPLSRETLAGINLAPAGLPTNLGLLKDAGKLSWPLPLQDDAFTGPRVRIDRNMLAAVGALRYLRAPGPDVLLGLQNDLQALGETLDARARDLSPTDYIASRRYLDQVKDTIRSLQAPAVGRYFDRSWTGTVLTVGDLVRYMTARGLEFAPAAAPGDEPCYTALYHALHDFDLALHVCS
jgi:hypothetical protein